VEFPRIGHIHEPEAPADLICASRKAVREAHRQKNIKKIYPKIHVIRCALISFSNLHKVKKNQGENRRAMDRSTFNTSYASPLSAGIEMCRLNFYPILLLYSDHWRTAVPTLAVPMPVGPVSFPLRAAVLSPEAKEDLAKGLS
jgi:hypothetical protein